MHTFRLKENGSFSVGYHRRDVNDAFVWSELLEVPTKFKAVMWVNFLNGGSSDIWRDLRE